MVGEMSISPGKWSAAAAASLAAAALLPAGAAAAAPPDYALLSALANYGIVVNNPDEAISMAHTVCAELDNHQRSSVLAMRVMKDAKLSARQAGFFVGASMSAYCPQYKGQTDDSLDWLKPAPPLM